MASLIDSSGPFALWDRPPAYPGADLVSGVPDSPVFDLGVDLDNKDGVAYIRKEHVIAMARTLGMVTQEEHDADAEMIGKLKHQLDNPESEIGRLANAVSELDALVRSVLAGSIPAGVPVEDSGETISADSGNDEVSGDSNESSDESRSDDIPESANDAANDVFGLGDTPVKSN